MVQGHSLDAGDLGSGKHVPGKVEFI